MGTSNYHSVISLGLWAIVSIVWGRRIYWIICAIFAALFDYKIKSQRDQFKVDYIDNV